MLTGHLAVHLALHVGRWGPLRGPAVAVGGLLGAALAHPAGAHGPALGGGLQMEQQQGGREPTERNTRQRLLMLAALQRNRMMERQRWRDGEMQMMGKVMVES